MSQARVTVIPPRVHLNLVPFSTEYVKKRVAAYARVSTDSEEQLTSYEAQVDYYTGHIKANDDWEFVKVYTDDGITGTVFNRPGLNAMVEEVKVGRVATVIIKDQSRIGRDVLEVGLLKRTFEENNVRFIAANDNLDTARGFDIMSIFRDVFNEWYVADTSKKIRAVKRSSAQAGNTRTGRLPYGYMRDPDDPQKYVIDEPAAEIVRELFRRVIGGDGVSKIANDLNRRGIDTSRMRYLKVHELPFPDEAHQWSGQQVQQIIQNETYVGNRVLQRLTTPSYKNHTRVIRPREEWCVFENHHEPLVSDEVFETVQKLRSVRRKFSTTGDLGVLNGLVYCKDCGDRLRIFHDISHNYSAYLCRRYPMGKCTRHSINRPLLEKLVLEELQRVTEFARSDKAKFVKAIQTEKDKAYEKTLKSQTAMLAKNEKRIAELDTIIRRIYEDHIVGKLSDERFTKMLATYEREQATLEADTAVLRTAVGAAKEKADGIDKFLKLCERYTDLTELTAEVARSFIEKIVVYEPVRAPGHKYKKQSQEIEMHLSFIGEAPKG